MTVNKNLLKLLKTKKDTNEFKNYLEYYLSKLDNSITSNINYNLFDKKKMGRSGAQIGIYSKNKIIKIYYNKLDKNIIVENKCIYISPIINEIIVNYVFNNLKTLTNISKQEQELVKNHIIKVYKYELSNNKQYLIMKKAGVKDTYKNKYYTNMTELIINNHIPWLIDNINNNSLIKKYDSMLTNKFASYFKALRVLQKHIKYINTDNKLSNIFISEDNTTNVSINNLSISRKNKTKRKTTINNKTKKRGINCITNFKLLITDLDKANINVNNTTIIPIKYSGLKKKFDPLRYTCHNYQFKNCKKLNVFEYDILMCIINLLILFKKTEKKHNIEIINKLPKLLSLFQKQFTFDNNTFNNIINLINNHNFIINIKKEVSTKLLTYLIIKFCKYIN